MFGKDKKYTIPTVEEALLGRAERIEVNPSHYVNGNSVNGPFPSDYQQAMFGLGCFWGAEKKFWQEFGVYISAVGYAAGSTLNPSYQEVCSGNTGHNEVVLVVFDPELTNYNKMLSVFWNSHNPTQGMAQGNDKGTQYRSGIYCFNDEQQQAAQQSRDRYQELLSGKGFSEITTEIITAPEFYFAEDYHQQYLAKNPNGYCGLGGIGVDFTN